MSRMIKPPLIPIFVDRVDPKWRWFWGEGSMHVLYRDGVGIPTAIVDGMPMDILTQYSASNWITGQAGLAGDYMAQVAHHISNSNLPSWFPGKGTNNNPYTCLAYLEIPTFVSGDFHNVFQKDNETANPYFLWLRDTGQVNFSLSSGSYQSTGGIAARTPSLVGSLFDGSNASIIINGKIEGSVASTVTANSASFNIATRTDSIADTNRILNGYMYYWSFFNRPLNATQLDSLASDPYGPWRPLRRMQAAAGGSTANPWNYYAQL